MSELDMNEVYGVLLDIKSDTGAMREAIDTHKKELESLRATQASLLDKHIKLDKDFGSHKRYFLLIAGFIGTLFGTISTWFYHKFLV